MREGDTMSTKKETTEQILESQLKLDVKDLIEAKAEKRVSFQ